MTWRNSISDSSPSPGRHYEFQESPKNLTALRPHTLSFGDVRECSRGRWETWCSYFIEHLNVCQALSRTLYILYSLSSSNITPVYKVRGKSRLADWPQEFISSLSLNPTGEVAKKEGREEGWEEGIILQRQRAQQRRADQERLRWILEGGKQKSWVTSQRRDSRKAGVLRFRVRGKAGMS